MDLWEGAASILQKDFMFVTSSELYCMSAEPRHNYHYYQNVCNLKIVQTCQMQWICEELLPFCRIRRYASSITIIAIQIKIKM